MTIEKECEEIKMNVIYSQLWLLCDLRNYHLISSVTFRERFHRLAEWATKEEAASLE